MDWDLPDGRWQFARYLVNGVAATLVHYGVLVLLVEVGNFSSASLANLVAAFAGITFSFIGSRHFVFRAQHGDWRLQFRRFVLLYAILAAGHAAVLFVWSDQLGYDFRFGFVLATGLQMLTSFLANKLVVFGS
jgi:putative flippase GtrA